MKFDYIYKTKRNRLKVFYVLYSYFIGILLSAMLLGEVSRGQESIWLWNGISSHYYRFGFWDMIIYMLLYLNMYAGLFTYPYYAFLLIILLIKRDINEDDKSRMRYLAVWIAISFLYFHESIFLFFENASTYFNGWLFLFYCIFTILIGIALFTREEKQNGKLN